LDDEGEWVRAYGQNPLATDVRYWGEWVLERAKEEIGQYYEDPEGGTVVAYLWARTAKCPNPACGAEMPLVRQWWLARQGKRKRIALKPIVNHEWNTVSFKVVRGNEIDFDPSDGTVRRGNAYCLGCVEIRACWSLAFLHCGNVRPLNRPLFSGMAPSVGYFLQVKPLRSNQELANLIQVDNKRFSSESQRVVK
jgi:adenine-specific DNA methylase